MFGPSETGIIEENLFNENKENAIELYYEKYLEGHAQLVERNSKIDRLLQFLKDKNMKLGIVTGKARRSLDISLKVLQMEDYFDVIITGDDVTKPKPDPEGVHKALSFLGIDNNEAMFVGDSEADIQAGKQAKVFTIGVHWLPEYQTIEFSTQPDVNYDSVESFIDYLEEGVFREL